ncbi:hypothetical protein DPX39_100053600 [Trypanosoma brucei equiperdum]|uniref:Uncharacterized protein n=1 Tax=Trypanosoma brucei equiperdum TaxID=630700 RepID=A0A3L6KZQ5_9TRYP|nr:hypothetical protein DPX39_100053600 [Trypanosoma brucei equiperdum]
MCYIILILPPWVSTPQPRHVPRVLCCICYTLLLLPRRIYVISFFLSPFCCRCVRALNMGSSGYDTSYKSSLSSAPSSVGSRTSRQISEGATSVFSGETSSVSGHDPVFRNVKRNPNLQFLKPDDSVIHVSPSARNVVRYIASNYDSFPDGHYRVVDYFRVAVEMFLQQVRLEYEKQAVQAVKNGVKKPRYTWGNKSGLAISYATSCDMLKLLYDVISEENRPKWDEVVKQFIYFLISESGIPGGVFSEQTYHTKFLDWRKGGTRYQNLSMASNVRFPSASHRRQGVENYLRSGSWLSMKTTEVTVLANTDGTSRGESMGGVTDSTPSCSNSHASSMCYPPATRIQQRINMEHPVVPAMAKQVDDFSPRRTRWREKLTQIMGSPSARGLGEDRSNMVLTFVRLCQVCDSAEQAESLTNIIVESDESIQRSFEGNGGIAVLRRFVGEPKWGCQFKFLFGLVEKLLRMRLMSWGTESRQSWLRDLNGRGRRNLDWLRNIEVIPKGEREKWTNLVRELEGRYVLMPSHRDLEQPARVKRPPTGREGLEQKVASSDGHSVKPQLCVSNSRCRRLPTEFLTLPDPEAEGDVNNFMDRKAKYCEDGQAEWRKALRKAAGVDLGGVSVPIWYDPYQLLDTSQCSSA